MRNVNLWRIETFLTTPLSILCLLIQLISISGMAIPPQTRSTDSNLRSNYSNSKFEIPTPSLDPKDFKIIQPSQHGFDFSSRAVTNTDYRFLSKSKRRRRQAGTSDGGPLEEICRLLPPDDNPDVPLQCYQCESNTKQDLDPQCDNRLFQYLRHSEKFNLKKRCTREKGHYCLKSIKRRFGERITTRGCYGAPVIGPDNKVLTAKEGCYTSPEGKYLTTTCFCSSNNCNSAPVLKLSKATLIMFLIGCLTVHILF